MEEDISQSANSIDNCEESTTQSDINKGTDDDQESTHDEARCEKKVVNVKKEKRGVLYFNYIPPGIDVKKMREIFTEFGDVTNIFLQPDKSGGGNKRGKKKRKVRNYTEGWLEYRKKKTAKLVANALNGKKVGGKRRNPFYDSLWSIKYLHRFKWSHLVEQLALEKAMRDQRLRFEVGQAKKETNFYINMHEEYKRRKRNKLETPEDQLKKREDFYGKKQRLTDGELRKEKRNTVEGVDLDLLKKIFS